MQLETNNKDDITEDREESLLIRWGFRFGALIFIILFCYFLIKSEFNSLKTDKQLSSYSSSVVQGIENSAENINDAWSKIYYFYQTGDLMNILRCPSAVTQNKRKQSDLLLSLYREDVETRQNINATNVLENYKSMKNLRCGGKVIINIGIKKEVYKHPEDYESYSFTLGEEPVSLIKKYPFIKNALSQIREGERMTFVAMPAETNRFMPKKQIIYEVEIPENNTNETIQIPFYSVLNKSNDKFLVENQITCGSVVNFKYSIYNILGKKLIQEDKIDKIKVGGGKLNNKIEQLMLQMSAGDHYMIFLSNDFLQKNDFFSKEILKNEVLLFEIKILNVQK